MTRKFLSRFPKAPWSKSSALPLWLTLCSISPKFIANSQRITNCDGIAMCLKNNLNGSIADVERGKPSKMSPSRLTGSHAPSTISRVVSSEIRFPVVSARRISVKRGCSGWKKTIFLRISPKSMLWKFLRSTSNLAIVDFPEWGGPKNTNKFGTTINALTKIGNPCRLTVSLRPNISPTEDPPTRIDNAYQSTSAHPHPISDPSRGLPFNRPCASRRVPSMTQTPGSSPATIRPWRGHARGASAGVGGRFPESPRAGWRHETAVGTPSRRR